MNVVMNKRSFVEHCCGSVIKLTEKRKPAKIPQSLCESVGNGNVKMQGWGGWLGMLILR